MDHTVKSELILCNKEVFVKPLIRRGIDNLVYAHVWKIKAFGYFRLTSGLFPGLYDHPLHRYSLEKNR